MFIQSIHGFLKKHGQGEGFFTAGTARDPDTHSGIRFFAVYYGWDNFVAEKFKGLGVSEKTGYFDNEGL